jgi:C4-dicarboxylate-specific signal transduction histidine kinase
MQNNQALIIQSQLEKKVTSRTAELKCRNKELANALDELKAIQENLIYSERLSTIGHLSAGIAHEIYNFLSYIPIASQDANKGEFRV